MVRGMDIVYMKKGKAEVRIVQSREEQKQILDMCLSKPTSGHFGVKTIFNQVRERL